ncbi:PDZ domain-containing protein [Candidatus Bathyarchaeota archaeon A05DMB-2]|jgi:S1-C subfamily serine protease|nr:PDZ domain-containing protein [Candidatus Bathyarchaeota archaeon A05DMB-2]
MEPSSLPHTSTKSRANRTYVAVILAAVLCSLLAGGFIGYVWSNSAVSDRLIDLQNQVNALSSAGNLNYQVIPDNVSLSQLYQNVRDSVVMVTGVLVQNTFFGQQLTVIQGSGFVNNSTGRFVVITNFHVIDGAENISVTFRDGDAYAASVLGSDAYADLAVLSVSAPESEFKPLQLASSSTLNVGDFVVAIGCPYGLTGSMTTGIVSQLGRTITESSTGGYSIANIIQISTPINPGNSGGPLLNDKGQVVGITTAGIADSQGVAFAIPSNTILREMTSLIDTGTYTQHPWIGLSGTDMTYNIAKQTGQNVTYGMLITQVASGGPADKAGLKAGTSQAVIDGTRITVGGDIIVAINGNRIVNGDDLSTYLEENTLPNQTVTVTIVRNGATMDVSLTLGTRPPPS